MIQGHVSKYTIFDIFAMEPELSSGKPYSLFAASARRDSRVISSPKFCWPLLSHGCGKSLFLLLGLVQSLRRTPGVRELPKCIWSYSYVVLE